LTIVHSGRIVARTTGARGCEVGVQSLRPHRDLTAFVLGGGGNLGSVQVGMLRALLERGVVPDLLVGCSAGAFNAATIAAEPTLDGVDLLHRTWATLDGPKVFPASGVGLAGVWQLARKGRSLGSNDGLRDLVERLLPIRRFEEAVVPFQVVATSLQSGRERWFAEGPVVEPILASAALPAVLPPVELDGDLLVDGGVVDNVPISRALHLGATRVYVLHVGNFDRPRPAPRRPIDVLLQSFSVARNHRFVSEQQPPAGIELITLPGVDPGNLKRNDFTQAEVLMARAHAAAALFLDTRHALAAAN
jgi:NTE family protein